MYEYNWSNNTSELKESYHKNYFWVIIVPVLVPIV